MNSIEYTNIRYLQIVDLLSKGNKHKDIAEKLNISYKTVEVYITRMMTEYDCCNGTHLVAHFLRNGLLK